MINSSIGAAYLRVSSIDEKQTAPMELTYANPSRLVDPDQSISNKSIKYVHNKCVCTGMPRDVRGLYKRAGFTVITCGAARTSHVVPARTSQHNGSLHRLGN